MSVIIEQRDPESFAWPQDLAGPEGRMIRYGGLSKREWIATMLLSGWFANQESRTFQADMSAIIACADALLAELNKPAKHDSSIYPLSRSD